MVKIHHRIHERHPEVCDSDVVCAWENQYRMAIRTTDAGLRFVAVGMDQKGRELEMVAIRTAEVDWLVFHAMTPPSRRTRSELGMIGEER